MGIPPAQLLRADPTELQVLAAAAQHARDWHEQRDRALARLVVSELAAAIKRSR